MQPITTDQLKIIITGGASGIGAATARLLAAGGAQILLADVQDEQGEALAAELGDRVRYQHLDVVSPEGWAQAVAYAEAEFGSVNALFNNAGVVGFAGLETSSPEEFRRVTDINLYGVFLGIHAVTPALKRAGGGAIVNTSSTAGLQGYGSLAGYVASKWGVRGLTKAAALDLAPYHIRVLSLHPGPIRTAMTEALPDAIAQAQPIPRFGEADEVARMVRFMFTEATYSTGSEFVIDGGAVTGQVLTW